VTQQAMPQRTMACIQNKKAAFEKAASKKFLMAIALIIS
jgi:hypothetical protein